MSSYSDVVRNSRANYDANVGSSGMMGGANIQSQMAQLNKDYTKLKQAGIPIPPGLQKAVDTANVMGATFELGRSGIKAGIKGVKGISDHISAREKWANTERQRGATDPIEESPSAPSAPVSDTPISAVNQPREVEMSELRDRSQETPQEEPTETTAPLEEPGSTASALEEPDVEDTADPASTSAEADMATDQADISIQHKKKQEWVRVKQKTHRNSH